MWHVLLIAAAIVIVGGLIILAGMVIFKQKRLTYYYIKAENNVPCVYANIEWDADSKVFCETDQDKLIERLNKLNQGLR